jgi:hypothetical protein
MISLRQGSRLVCALVLAIVALMAATAASQAKTPPRTWYSFAPYVDTTDSPPSFTATRKRGHVRRITLGFIVARNGNQCTGAWGGFPAYPGTGAKPYLLSRIKAFRRKGGQVVVSFGGQAGTELARRCSTAAALAAAYQGVIDTYGARYVDFDVEGPALSDTAANARRAQAIAALQRTRKLKVSYTLPVLPSGLDAEGLAAARGAKAAGVDVSLFNLMTMDYGSGAAPKPKGRMAGYAIRAAKATRAQLHGLYPGLGRGQLYRKIGVTPMIGVNDVATEVFTLRDARKLVKWARKAHVGALAMWALQRDHRCAKPSKQARNDCSGVAQKRWAFSRAFSRYRG